MDEIKISRSGFEDEIGRKLSDDEWQQIEEAVSETVISFVDEFSDNELSI